MRSHMMLSPMSLSGMGMFDSSRISIPAVGQRLPVVEGYVVIQDDARPELAVVMFDGEVVATATLGVPQQAHEYGFMSEYHTKYEVVLKINIGTDEWDISIKTEDLSYVRGLVVACKESEIAPLLRLCLDDEVNEEGFTIDTDYVDNLITRLENHFPEHGLDFYPSDAFFSHTSGDEPDNHLVAIVDRVTSRLIGYVQKSTGGELTHQLFLSTGRSDLISALL